MADLGGARSTKTDNQKINHNFNSLSTWRLNVFFLRYDKYYRNFLTVKRNNSNVRCLYFSWIWFNDYFKLSIVKTFKRILSNFCDFHSFIDSPILISSKVGKVIFSCVLIIFYKLHLPCPLDIYTNSAIIKFPVKSKNCLFRKCMQNYIV